MDIVKHASQNKSVILSFNVPYLPMVEPVIKAVVDQNAFAMIATARLEWYKFQSHSLAAVAEEYARWKNDRHVWLHLDHVPVIDEDGQRVDFMPLFFEAIALGYQSVMIDGSRLPLVDNIDATKKVIELTRSTGIPCEAELGAVLGHESGPLPSYEELFLTGKGFTDPEEARLFVETTGCDWLSVAVGNIHGAVSGVLKDQKKVEARLNIERIEQLARMTNIPLVLHGGSGIHSEYITEAIRRGVAKINIGTEIRQAYEKEYHQSNDIGAAQARVYERVTWLLRDFYKISSTEDGISEPTRD